MAPIRRQFRTLVSRETYRTRDEAKMAGIHAMPNIAFRTVKARRISMGSERTFRYVYEWYADA